MPNDFYPDALDREYARRRAEAAEKKREEQAAGDEQGADKTATSRQRKPKIEKHPSGPGMFTRMKHFFTDRRTTMFAGIASICWGAYMLVASISFFTVGASDQSAARNMSASDFMLTPDAVENAAGGFGAILANDLITNGLGLGALILIYYFFALGWRLLNRKKLMFWSLTMKCLIDAIALSVVAGYIAIVTGIDSWIYWGGVHGHQVNLWLMNVTGQFGALLVNILLVALVACIYLNELRLVYLAYRREMRKRRERIEAERAAKEERQRLMREQLEKSDMVVDEHDAEEEDAEEDTQSSRQLHNIDIDVAFNPEDEPEYHDRPYSPHYHTPYEAEEPVAETPAATEPEEEEVVEEEVVEEDPKTAQIPSSEAEEATVEEPAVEDDEVAGEDIEAPGEPVMEVTVNEIEQARPSDFKTYDPTLDLSHYRFPSIELLDDIRLKADCVDESEMEENKERITTTLNSYKIPISRISATVGPTVTLYEIVPAEGVRIAQIRRLEDDIALSLAALGIRIIAPIPGKGTIGIEVPNKEPQMVPIRSILGSKKFQETKCELPMALGATIQKEVFIADLAKVPHLLVAGATGQGKSVGLNTIIASLLYKKHPSELKFVLIDPKTVEFTLYNALERHYLAKLPDEESAIICDPMKVVTTLNSLCIEMENRFRLFNKGQSRDIKEYNKKFINRQLNPENGHQFMPYIVVIIDEFADLIMVAGKEVEKPVARLAQKARAAGIHIILATQRPSTDVITGMIKANFPGRIAFRVMQMVDSRTILDRPGANQLIGKGDMLISLGGEITRLQCAFISTDEVVRVCKSVDDQVGYPCAYELPEYVPESESSGGNMNNVNDRDSLFEEAARFTVTSGTASTSSLQRRYSIGYNRAGKIMDQLEAAGIVGPASGAKPRSVLVDTLQLERMLEML